MSKEYLHKLFGIEGRVAVVIGGSGCLGGLLSEGLARAGATIVVAGRNAGRGHRRVEVIRSLGGQAGFVAVDAMSEDSLRQFADRVLDDHGNVDILVNAAAAGSVASDPLDTWDAWRRIMDGRLATSLLACQTFAPRMARQEHGGVILNLGYSRSAPSAGLSLPKGPSEDVGLCLAHSTVTAAMVDLTHNLGRRYAPRGVRFHMLHHDAWATDCEGRGGENHEGLIGAMLLAVSRSATAFGSGVSI